MADNEKPSADADLVNKWTAHIAQYERTFKKWESRVEKIIKRYRDEQRISTDTNAKFNILWSNVQTLVPAVYSKIPKPDVSRRFNDSDPVGRVASLILERALEFDTEHYPDFRATMNESVMDRFLGGRATAWARYEPHMKAAASAEPVDGVEISEDVDEPQEELDYECAPTDYVHWRDFGHTTGRTWEEVTAVWRRVFLTREQCVERFGEELGSKIPLDSRPEEEKKNNMATADVETSSRACVYEIWDKETKQAIWLGKSMKQILDQRDDPLGLEDFFPCPRPLYATITNESLVPVPDFTLYQDQARELDTLAERIDGLIQALQVKGVYDDSIGALARIFTEGSNGTLIPVKNWAAFAEKNGLAGAIDIVDLKPIYEALKVAFEAAKGVMQQIYDLTGMSDIVRGQSEASETATAQQIKGQYASLRLKAFQYKIAHYATELLQLKAQIICAKFDPKVILTMAQVQQLSPNDQQYIQPAMELLIGPERMADPAAKPGPNPMRVFRVEVNADTMVQIDEKEEKEQRAEFLKAQAAFMKEALPLAQAAPVFAPIVASMWKFAIGAFKVGKTIEGDFDAVIAKLQEAARQPQQPKPNPEMERVKADAQIQQARVQADQQAQQAKLVAEQQEAQREERRMAMEHQREQMKIQAEYDFKRWMAELDARTKIEVAEISAKATLAAGQMKAASQATEAKTVQ